MQKCLIDYAFPMPWMTKEDWKEIYSNARAQGRAGNKNAQALLRARSDVPDGYVWKSFKREWRFYALTVANPKSRHWDGIPF